MAMTRKRALSRQQRDDTSKYSPSRANNRASDLENEPGSSFLLSPPEKKSLYRHPFVPKSNCMKWGKNFLRTILGGDLFKTILLLVLLLSIVSLVLGKLVFDVGRYFLMSRPTILYGSPTDWGDVAGCLSLTHRQEVNDHFETDNNIGEYHQFAQLPLDPDVEWNWSRFSSSHSSSKMPLNERSDGTNHTKPITSTDPRRRLLIAQYSGKGSYQRLLEEVEPINRAYAKKFGHDYVTLVGTGLKFPGLIYETPESDSSGVKGEKLGENQRFCRYFNKNEIANNTNSSSKHYNYEAQSTFNKIPLLFKAMEESPSKYDQVLILDSDTMIVDFDYDITSLLLAPDSVDPDRDEREEEEEDPFGETSEGIGSTMKKNHNTPDDLSYFLVAYRVWKYDWLSTWDVNAGITLWNLRHPSTRIVAEDWLKLSLSDPKQVLLKNDDQYFLQRALQRHTSFLPAVFDRHRDTFSGDMGSEFAESTVAGRYIRAIRDEFEYYDASVIKHFKRDTASWSRTGLDQRLLRIREVKDEICRLWPDDCPS